VTLALEAAGNLFNERRAFSVQRQHIIDGSAELQERELIKLSSLGGARQRIASARCRRVDRGTDR